MKKALTISFSLALALLPLFFISCKKDKKEDKPSPISARTEILTARPWKTIAIGVNPPIDTGSGPPVSDIYATRAACEQDDLSRYKLDKTFTYEEGATKCDINDPDIYDVGTWEFNADETTLTEKPTLASAKTYDIIQLTADKMVLTTKEIKNSVEYTYTATFVPQ